MGQQWTTIAGRFAVAGMAWCLTMPAPVIGQAGSGEPAWSADRAGNARGPAPKTDCRLPPTRLSGVTWSRCLSATGIGRCIPAAQTCFQA